jgi:peroxiredoxin
MERLKKMENELGFKLLLINLKGYLNKTKAIIKEKDITIPILFDCESYSREVLHVNYTPTTFIIDENGVIRSRLVGGCEDFEKIVVEVIENV